MSSSSADFNSDNAYLQNLLQVEDTKHFTKSLQNNFPQTTINILSMGCGDAGEEVKALDLLFASKNITFNYVGIDIDKRAIAHNKKYYQDAANKKNSIVFDEMSIVDKESIAKLFGGKPVHVMIFRHPVLWESNEVSKFFNFALTDTLPNTLTQGGTLLVSIYHPEEKLVFEKLMSTVTAQSVISLPEKVDGEYTTETQQTHCTDIVRKVITDRFFFAITNFQLNPAQKMELSVVEDKSQSNRADQLFNYYKNLYGKITLGKMTNHVQYMIDEWLKNIATNFIEYKTLSSEDMTSALIDNVLKRDDATVIEKYDYKYSILAYSIVKTFLQDSCAEKSKYYLQKLLDVMIKSIKSSSNGDEFLTSAHQYLKLIENKPLVSDLFPAASISQKSEIYPPASNQSGLW